MNINVLHAPEILECFRVFGVPFFIAGALKIVYDVLLYKKFAALPPDEEMACTTQRRMTY